MVVNDNFALCEMNREEMLDIEGGFILNTYISIRSIVYQVNMYNYNMEVAEINGYNDTVTNNGRSDLVKSYPEKPTW